MLSGIPGSGKTTRARELVKSSGQKGRINRDDLRAMLFNSVWSGKREAIVVDCEKAIAEVLLRHKNSIVVDNTHLLPKHRDAWSAFAKEHDIQFETERINESLEECIRRDSLRAKPVGQAIINRFALQGGLIEWGDKQLVLVDIDGTLSLCQKRLHHLQSGKKNWRGFFDDIPNDEPIDFVIRWVRELAKDFTICLVSGRPDTHQTQTIDWLRKYNVPFDFIFMRSGTDGRPDTDIKQDILNYLPKSLIFLALDDRPCVINQVWRKNGVRVIPVQGACEDF